MRNITQLEPRERQSVLAVWEASVRATHFFLKEADLLFYKEMLSDHFPENVRLYGIKSAEGLILGFSGLSDDRLEMLFVRPECRGTGIGKALLSHAVQNGIRKTDVNEQNAGALAFYEHAGFRTTGRSAIDDAGKPYPILHMELAE